MKNTSDTIGNRTRDRPTCNAVPQPTAPPPSALFTACNLSITFSNIFYNRFVLAGHAVAQLVEALRYKSEVRGFYSRWCHWNFLLT